MEVTKDYAHSCSSDIDEAIKKARRNGGMIFLMGFDSKKVNPLIYIKLWKQICLPSLVFGSELWSLTKTDVACLERCQNWFVRKVFNLPKFSSHLLLLKISGLISVENEIAKRKLFFFARMALSTSDTVFGKLFQARVRSFLSIQNNSFSFIKDVVLLMHKYSLSDYFDNWTRNKIFPSYFGWKRIVKSRIAAHENNAWTEYASMHQDTEILNKTFSCMTINEFWEIVDRTPDLAFKRNLQIRLMGNFGLQYEAPWLRKSGNSTCLLCKNGNVENVFHFLFAYPKLEDEWAIFWYILKEKVSNSDYLEKNILLHFIDNLDKPTTARLLLGGLSLPFNSRIADFLNKFIAVSIRKIYRIRQNMIREVLSS